MHRAFPASFVPMLVVLLVLDVNTFHPAVAYQAVTTPGTTPLAAGTGDWPIYRGNPERTGNMPGPGIDGQPVELWRVEVEGSIESAPAVVNGVLYFGAGDGGVSGLDTTTGALIWQFGADSPISSSPAVVNGRVYAGSDHGTLYALDAASGQEQWTFPGTRADASVAVVDDVIYTGSEDGQLYAIDAATGKELWRTSLGEVASRSASVADGVVYIGSADGVLHTFNASSGEPGWTFQTEGDGIVGTPAIVNGTVFQTTFEGAENHVYALDAATGDERWRFDQAANPGFLPVATNGALVFVPSLDNHVYALDADTGTEVWRFQTGGRVEAAPALIGDTLYVAGMDSFVHALDTGSGKALWQFAIDGDANYGPTVVDGVAYVGTSLGSIYAIGGSETVAAATPEASPVTGMTTGPAATAPGGASPESAAAPATFLWETQGGDPALHPPSDVTIAPDGTIWVAGGFHSQFQLFSQDGTFLEAWGEPGTDKGQFNFVPTGGDDAFGAIAFAPDGSFYVADTGNQRIQHFSADRQFIRAWGQPGSGDGQFLNPFDIEVDSQGNVFVNDDLRDDIQKFNADGTFVLKFGGQGSAPGQLDFQDWMTVDNDDNVWVADGANHRIQQWDNDGNFLAEYDGEGALAGPYDVAVDDTGHIYVADSHLAQVFILDPSGAVMGAFGERGAGEGQFDHPDSLALDGQGHVYVTDADREVLMKFQLQPPFEPAE